MGQFHTRLKQKKTRTFLAALSLAALLMPGSAMSAERDGSVLFFSLPLERSYFWGNGLGIDGYARPGTRPLWGY